MREREEYAVCSFVFLLLILMMMMMFRTVLLFFFFSSYSLSLSLTLRNSLRERKKTGTFLKDDKTCLLVARSGLNSAMVLLFSSSLQKKLLLFFFFFFFFFLRFFSLFYSNHPVHNCVYNASMCIFSRFPPSSFLSNSALGKDGNGNKKKTKKKKKKLRSCITHTHIPPYMDRLFSFLSPIVCSTESSSYFFCLQ